MEEPRFAIVPEWVSDAPVSDGAFRLYSLLLRYGNSSDSQMPSWRTLARRLRRPVRRPPMGVAAKLRPNPEFLTNKPPPPTPAHRGRSAPTPAKKADYDLLGACPITNLDELTRQRLTARQVLGKPTAHWTAR